jgi:thymidylate synthase
VLSPLDHACTPSAAQNTHLQVKRQNAAAAALTRRNQSRCHRPRHPAGAYFQPRTDTTYIPCVSLLDFWLPGGAVELVVYAHSIDFGAKGYGNLAELASLQHRVAGELGRPVGRLLMMVKSAHVYETERAYVLGLLADRDDSRLG